MISYILTAKVCKSNAEQFPDILKLYVNPGAKILDMTWGNGAFWKDVTETYEVVANDIDPERGKFHYDFRQLPNDWKGIFSVCVCDPPYLGVGGIETLKDSIDRGYNNKARAKNSGGGVAAVRRLYAGAIIEAWRILCRSGILILKCMDQVESGRQNFLSHDIMDLCNLLGFRVDDELIFVSSSQPTMRHEHQVHARRNHSSWVVAKRRP